MKTLMKWVSVIGVLFFVLDTAALDLGGLRDKLKAELPVNPKLTEAAKELKGPDETEEIAIGRQIAGDLLGAAPLVKDAKLQKYVNQVGEWVASQSERPDLPWHFGVIQSNDVNAFAAPGGYIFVTLGLYRLLQERGRSGRRAGARDRPRHSQAPPEIIAAEQAGGSGWQGARQGSRRQ